MRQRIAFCFVAAFVSSFGLAACGGGDEEQQEAQQETPQKQTTTERQETQQQTAQQEPTQQDTQAPSSTTQGSDVASQLTGMWEATSYQGEPVPPGTEVLAFSHVGTLQVTTSDDFQSSTATAQYSILDDSQIQFIDLNEESPVGYYSLEGDTLTLTVQGETTTYQRIG